MRLAMDPEGDGATFKIGSTWQDLLKELTIPNYKPNRRGRTIVEAKEDIKKRLGRSPDLADALALTFASDCGEFGMELL